MRAVERALDQSFDPTPSDAHRLSMITMGSGSWKSVVSTSSFSHIVSHVYMFHIFVQVLSILIISCFHVPAFTAMWTST